MRGRALLVNGTLAVLLAGGIGFAYVSLGDDGATASATTRTTAVMRGDLTASVVASGAVESATKRALAFSGSGTVSKVHVAVGATVKKGQKLAELDRTEAQEELDSAKAQLAVAADGDTSTAQGNASYVQAKNAVSTAQRALDGTVLYAPFDGTVTAVNGSVGESASGSSASSGSSGSANSSSSGFIELADPGAVQVTGKFTEADATKLKVGQAATVTFAALSGVTTQGEVAAIDSAPTTENNVVTFAVTVTLKEKPAQVRIGQTASATVTVSEVKDALYVPSAAVTSAGGQTTVTVLENGKPVVKTVTVGIAGSSGTEIKSGLKEGEQVRITVATGTGGSGAQVPGGGGLGGGAMAPGGSGGRAPGGGGGR
ncbi:efflux RND transporter periplasmic adaptor subunit [Streptomyces virginiae]|uniref:efflux RND transporter periplasmic adaptor subunit n=1 Tax=Streptomyces virginiae TaxID=1961 RepID=UPI00225B5295|nr:efflux RND transporter periplasmic adaptor subunit [Streptomyces virginiae]MCX5272681.1 efflux RND transporter periplasmic adaptor subunit [Streptomyces virginiae]